MCAWQIPVVGSATVAFFTLFVIFKGHCLDACFGGSAGLFTGERLQWYMLTPTALLGFQSHATVSLGPCEVILFEPGMVIELREPQGILGILHRTFTVNSLLPGVQDINIMTSSSVTRLRPCSGAHAWAKHLRHATQAFRLSMRARHGSFAPPRNDARCCWFVDGAQLYAAQLAALRGARHRISITDWMLSPELVLERRREGEPGDKDSTAIGEQEQPGGEEAADGESNGSQAQDSSSIWDGREAAKLMNILKDRADAGVEVRIMLWGKEAIQLAADVDGPNAKRVLESISDKIQVVLHSPDGINANITWTHHEKLLVVDDSVAFVGGIDLAFGRYDDGEHLVADDEETTWRGKDYYNPRLCEQELLHEPYNQPSKLDRMTQPRMPWHDVAVCTVGEAAVDVARHFAMRWNNHMRRYANRNPGVLLAPLNPQVAIHCKLPPFPADLPGAQAQRCQCQVLRSGSLWSLESEQGKTENSIYEAYLAHIASAEHFIYIENQYFISSTCEAGAGGDVPKNTIAQALMEGVNM